MESFLAEQLPKASFTTGTHVIEGQQLKLCEQMARFLANHIHKTGTEITF